MRRADLARLLLLASIWGASFLFMRILAPVLGPLWTAEVRVGLAGTAMLLFMAATHRSIDARRHWKAYLVLGMLNSALPFALYAFAALTLPSGYSAILNATSPLWGALAGAAFLDERLTVRKIAGLLIGIAGVTLLVRLGPAQFSADVLIAACACIGAAICYGLAGVYSKKVSAGIAPAAMATGSQVAATFILMPFLPMAALPQSITPGIIAVAAALALLCSGVAYFIYFRLIADIGPTRTLTVTFLVPLFALLWGALFLNEQMNAFTLAGCALVVWATWLVAFQKVPATMAAAARGTPPGLR